MRFFHWLGILLFGLALACLAGDVIASLTGGEGFRLRALGEWWAWIHRDSLLLLQPAIERHLSPALWDPGFQTVLEWPAVADLAVAGALFWLLGRIRRKTVPTGSRNLKFRK